MMVAHNEEANKTAYTVTVDYKIGTSPTSRLCPPKLMGWVYSIPCGVLTLGSCIYL